MASHLGEVTDVIGVCPAVFETRDLGLTEATGPPGFSLRLAPGEAGQADNRTGSAPPGGTTAGAEACQVCAIDSLIPRPQTTGQRVERRPYADPAYGMQGGPDRVADFSSARHDRDVMKVPPTATEAFCEWCVEHPSRPCPACNARRRRAVRLVEGNGLPIDEAARQMRLPVPRVERLLEEEADRRTLAQFRQTHIENAPLRELFLALRRSDPTLTRSRARSAGRDVGDPGRAVARPEAHRAKDRRSRAQVPGPDPDHDQRRECRATRPRDGLRAMRDRRMLTMLERPHPLDLTRVCAGYAAPDGWHAVYICLDDGGRWQVFDASPTRGSCSSRP